MVALATALLLVGTVGCGDDGAGTGLGGGQGGTAGSGGTLPGELASSVTRHGITFTFDREYSVGQFANGDWWVVGPVTLAALDPAYDGQHHGWEINPTFEGSQGFDERAGSFDAALVPALPHAAQPGASVVKAESVDPAEIDPRPSLKTAAVLTVVAEPPPDLGATVFRPPYVGSDKPYYSVDDLRTDLLPAYPPVADMPSLDDVHERFEPVQLDHKGGATGRQLHPTDTMPDYGADIGRDNADAALRLMVDDPVADRMPTLIVYVQYGIDLYHMMLDGHTWPAGGGHRPGQKLPVTFAATLLDHSAMGEAITAATYFHEDNGVGHSDTAGRALFGFSNNYWSEDNYWQTIITGDGFKSHFDPYGYIDGGLEPGGSYQFCCISQPWKGSALALHLLPEMKTIWDNAVFFEYIDRWVTEGAFTQPDPCAPFDGNADNYGVTYGPDGNGGCILDVDPADGTGRFPGQHQTAIDDGHRQSPFQTAMWNAYR